MNIKKGIAVFSAALLMLSTFNVSAEDITVETEGCPMQSAETLVCSVVVCSIGILIPESHSECVKVKTKFAIYLATLGFWSKPPSCKQRDENCEKTGKASNAEIDPEFCMGLGTDEKVQACLAAGGFDALPMCSEYTGFKKTMCEEQYGTKQSCAGLNPMAKKGCLLNLENN